MSISSYTSQVNRLTDELARLRSSLADERKKLANANSKALKAVEALDKASSASQLRSKGRDVERHQKAAAAHEKKAAEIEKKVAAKQKSLTSAKASLDRAERTQQKADDREVDKRRRADLDHIKEMERARRSQASFPDTFQPRPSLPEAEPALTDQFTDTYDVCLSFAGEQRDYVERIAAALEEAGLGVFYDQDKDIAPSFGGATLASTSTTSIARVRGFASCSSRRTTR